jgi:hypothetical protein
MPRHRDARRFDLAICNPGRLEALEPILTKANLTAAGRDAGHAPSHLLSVLNFLRHQHNVSPFSISDF